MPKYSEFEEKEFELPLYYEILDAPFIWAPGQVFENNVGFDAALYISDIIFWKKLGYSRPLRGVFLNDYHFPHIWKKCPHRKFPSFKLNLFLQVKRAEKCRNRTRGLSKYK